MRTSNKNLAELESRPGWHRRCFQGVLYAARWPHTLQQCQEAVFQPQQPQALASFLGFLAGPRESYWGTGTGGSSLAHSGNVGWMGLKNEMSGPFRAGTKPPWSVSPSQGPPNSTDDHCPLGLVQGAPPAYLYGRSASVVRHLLSVRSAPATL